MKKHLDSKGFTLVELIMTIVLAGIILAPTSMAVFESLRRTYYPEHFVKAKFLLDRELERMRNLRFSAVGNQGPTAYTGNFSGYFYQVSFSYVNSGSLNTTVQGPTDYKRITVTITSPGLPDVSAVTLVTNH